MAILDLTMEHWLNADRRVFQAKRKYIEGALNGDTGIIKGVNENNKQDIFYMLMFCLCVPQSKAIKVEEAIEDLRKADFYTHDLSLASVTKVLEKRVRFHPTKAKRLIEARKVFWETTFWKVLCAHFIRFKESSSPEVVLPSIRMFLMQSINGLGMKTSSHFMRNIGMSGLAILDVHIIDGLYKRGIIDVDKLGPSKNEYLSIEQKMKDYAVKVGISLDELDLLLWSQKTGYVFK